MEVQIAPESMKMVSWQPSSQRVMKKIDFWHFLACFLSHFYIDFSAVLDVGFDDIQSILATRACQNQTGKHSVLHQKQCCRKIDSDGKTYRKV